MIFLTGFPVIILCLLLQAIFVAIGLRRLAHFRKVRSSRLHDFVLLAAILLLLLLGNIVQVAIWAALFVLIGEFHEFPDALYHSGVNFVTLGYGDIVMSGRWRLLGPLEAANGILMFGLSTAVMTAAVFDVANYNVARSQSE